MVVLPASRAGLSKKREYAEINANKESLNAEKKAEAKVKFGNLEKQKQL